MTPNPSEQVEELFHGDTTTEPSVTLLGGYFVFDPINAPLLLDLLPRMLHLRATEPTIGSVATIVELIQREAREKRAGRALVLTCLIEVMLVEALRSVQSDLSSTGLLAGLRDPQLTAALRGIHTQTAHPGTLATLAREAGMSRSSFAEKGLHVVGVPKTIDNDLECTMTTFGFDSAVKFATECIDHLHFTAESHRRVMVVEVMGRYAGWLALHAGIAGRADAILILEIPYDIAKVAAHIKRRTAGHSHQYSIVVVAEGAKPAGGGLTLKEAATVAHVERLGGVGEIVAGQLRELTGKETRTAVPGHLLRGGQPTSLDRSLGLIFGAAAVRALVEGQDGVMVAVNPPQIDYVPLRVATAKLKLVTADDYGVMTALDISFGNS